MQQRSLCTAHVWVLAILLGSAWPSAKAQSTFQPPDVDIVDPAGVSLISGHAQFTMAPVSIGPKGSPLVFKTNDQQAIGSQAVSGYGMYGIAYGGNNFTGYLEAGYVTVQVFDKSEVFVGDRVSSYHSLSQTGGQLTVSNGNVTQYTDRDGVQYNFLPLNPTSGSPPSTCTNNVTPPGITEVQTYSPTCALLTSVVYPDGTTLTLSLSSPNAIIPTYAWVRSDGFALHADYQSAPNSPAGTNTALQDVLAVNLAVDYCDMTQVTLNCTFSETWPKATYSWSPLGLTFTAGFTQTLAVTDQTGAVTQYTQEFYPSAPQGNIYMAVNAVKASTSASATTATYQTSAGYVCTDGGGYWNCQATRVGMVTAATTGNGNWSYIWNNYGYGAPIEADYSQNWAAQATRADGSTADALYNSRWGFPQAIVTATGSYFYNSYFTQSGTPPNNIQQAVDSEGRTFNFVYDARGNITSKQQVDPSGNTLPAWTANFDTTCTYPVKCNKPNWTKDPNGNETDYTYDTTHGGVLTETLPADSNGVRPQKRYSYTQLYAWIKNSSGGYSQSASPIWKLSSMSYCISGSWNGTNCVNSQGSTIAGDLVVTTYNYGPNSGPNNLLLRGETVTAGSPSVSHTTCYGYDWLGNKISETSPNAGLTSCP